MEEKLLITPELEKLAVILYETLERHRNSLPFEDFRIPGGRTSSHDIAQSLMFSRTPLLSHDSNGILNFYNFAAASVFLYKPAAVIGKMRSRSLVPDDQIDARTGQIEDALRNDRVVESDIIRLNKLWERIPLHAWYIPYIIDGQQRLAAIVKTPEMMK